jgi:hypothetical protein
MFVGLNMPVNTALTFVADIPLTNEILVKWEAAALFAASCGHSSTFAIFAIFCSWSLIYDIRLLERVLLVNRVTWDASETHDELVSMCFFNYSIQKHGHEVFKCLPKTAQCPAKVLIVARLPCLVAR